MHWKVVILLLLFVSFQALADIVEEKDRELAEETQQNTQDKRAPCPGGGNCNGHGSCNNGVCTCSQGWAGTDCSFAVTALTSGVSLKSQHVDRSSWRYYTIPTSSASTLIVTVNQTSVGGDADLYMLPGDFPTRTHYTQRDISGNQNFVVTATNTQAGTYYIGIYGYLATDFIITATVSLSLCAELNNCNPPNGVCVSQGVCQCNSGYGGTDCSIVIKPLTLGSSYTESVGLRGWVYYSTSITRNNNLQLILSQTGGDVDVYIKAGSLPTLWTYDYRDTSLANNITLNINEPALGVWYFGFYGYSAASFTFTVSTNNQCPSNCSKHGVCYAANCQCYSGFTGIYCQTMNPPLTLNTPVAGYVDDNSWNYYSYTAYTESNLIVSINQTSRGDCDLYIRQGSNPTKFQYDYKDIGINSNFRVTVSQPSGTYFMGVYGYSSCEYTITATLSTACPGNPPCGGHGTCTPEGICLCDSNWFGSNCTSSAQSLTNGQTTQGSVRLNGWQYFQLPVINTTFLAVGVRETNTVGYLWTYVSKGRTPDLRNYDYADQDTNSKYHHLKVTFNDPQTDTWIIGVYANPFAANGPISYTLSAWYSPF